MSSHFPQYSFTDWTPGTSDIPVGRRGRALQSTRGHLPNSDFLYFSTCLMLWLGVMLAN